MQGYKSGESFIDHIYQELINSEEVKKAIARKGVNPDSRETAVKIYMERIEKAHDTPRKIEILKAFYYRKYVIDHLPESYIMLQWKIAREQGQGNIRITEERKNEWLRQIQENQKKSIDRWIDYLNNEDAMYPTWFKFYAFQGMLKLGQFDKEKKKFRKRTKDTTSPFISVNPEILSQMYTMLSKLTSNKTLTFEEIKALENGESFQKLYTYLLIQMEEQKAIRASGIAGKWIKYEQGDNYQELWKSLQGKNTGWCTVGEDVCKKQIKLGDFYVYYTYDENGNPTEPRIAIRMEGQSKIAEVRGIGNGQNLESEMIEIASKKLSEFPNKEGEKYQKKAHDMSLLTKIERKTNNNEELTYEEIVFLYELKSYISGFGLYDDPRIGEIIGKRNIQSDYDSLTDFNDKVAFLLRIAGYQINKGFAINEYDVIIEAVKQNIHVLEYAKEELKKDRGFVLEAVKQNGFALQYADGELKKDREIVLEAVKENGLALQYADEELKNDREFVLEAVKQNGLALKYVKEELRKDWEIVLEAVKQNGLALKYAKEELRNDREIVLEAVKENGLALQYADEELKKDREIVLEAAKENGFALQYAAAELKHDRTIRSESRRNK